MLETRESLPYLGLITLAGISDTCLSTLLFQDSVHKMELTIGYPCLIRRASNLRFTQNLTYVSPHHDFPPANVNFVTSIWPQSPKHLCASQGQPITSTPCSTFTATALSSKRLESLAITKASTASYSATPVAATIWNSQRMTATTLGEPRRERICSSSIYPLSPTMTIPSPTWRR